MKEYIPRIIAGAIEEAQPHYPVTVVTGPRQSGKSTLCRHLFPEYTYVNLEDITLRFAAMSDPTSFIDNYCDKVILDEVQNVPELLSMIQVRVDEDRSRRFILTGSSNFALLKKVTQSLAGRSALFTLLPFSFPEMKGLSSAISEDVKVQMLRGQYPGVVAEDIPFRSFYSNYYSTYVERDIRDGVNVRNLLKFDTFVRLLASRVGSEFNSSALAREVGVSAPTISEWLSILAASYIVYTVRPYFNNATKRLTKMPKIYFYDTGLLCYLLTLDTPESLSKSPAYGAIFENLAMGELLKSRINQGKEPGLNFYRESSGREVDALIREEGKLNLYEIKSGQTYRAEYAANMTWLAEKLPQEIGTRTVIYNGPTIAPVALNIHDV